MADHQHGSMDTKDHERVYGGFITFSTRAVIVIVAALLLLAMINA